MAQDMGAVFGKNLVRVAEARGLNQAELGAAVGLGRSSMSRIATGAQEPKVGTAFTLARALGVSLDVLLDDPSGPAPGDVAMVPLTADERDLIRVARRVGIALAFDRVVGVPTPGPLKPAA